jgi:hypothetical protein
VDWAQVRLILAARRRMLWNRMSRSPWVAALNIVLYAAFGFLAVVLNSALGAWVHGCGDREVAGAAVHLVYLCVFFMLATTPPLQLRGNEFLDVTKLFVHPVSHRTVFAATLCGLMTSGSVLFFTLPAVAVSVGAASSAAGAFAGAVVALLLVAVSTAVGQFLLLTYLNTLRSRRWRDLVTWLAPLVFGAFYVAFRLEFGGSAAGGQIRATLRWLAGWIDWTLPLPSWWGAHAVTGEGWLRWLPALALVPALAWLVRAAAVLQERAYHGEVPAEPAVNLAARRSLFARVAQRLPDPIGAVAEKELALFAREPAVRSLLVSQAIYAVVPLALALWNAIGEAHEAGGLARLAPFAACVAYPLLLAELGIAMNLLGLEGGGVVHALLLPVPRRIMLLGKDAAYLIVFGTVNGVVGCLAVLAAHLLAGSGLSGDVLARAALGFLEGPCAVAAALAVGNVNAVISPVRLAVRDRRALRQQMSGREGCLRSLQGLAGVFATAVLCLPVFLLFHWGDIVHAATDGRESAPVWLRAVLPLAATLFCAVAVWVGAVLGGAWLGAREEPIVANLARSEE